MLPRRVTRGAVAGAEEDAQTDPVFKEFCIESTYHPTWDKVYGDPSEPATSIIFGEKGSGKTAMRLQLARHLEHYNERHPGQRLFVVHYDEPIDGHRDWRQRNLTVVGGGESVCIVAYAPLPVWKKSKPARNLLTAIVESVRF